MSVDLHHTTKAVARLQDDNTTKRQHLLLPLPRSNGAARSVLVKTEISNATTMLPVVLLSIPRQGLVIISVLPACRRAQAYDQHPPASPFIDSNTSGADT
ncbi:hypothetical protein FPSE_11411 [Fusarium pseudograminearum CS3096]|uniref:Uncharacterized protein n=1 Tax=Fusarium pseudograminearum (strain CS3096) TaxID=1028729 RepID=K3V8Y2_FUSPC|nr:hypothetical protein FPSE_11411 [Fusarium pseudograminearum CS3096]EKJ68403.1 hypothetical protein FPSE_11411 [Fusarium pseudograminearum CS3096]